jgi:outer membrane lipoprotein-sorting protein
MPRLLLPGLALMLALVTPQAAPTAADAFQIAQRADQLLRGRTQHARVAMTVRTPDWERTLEMESWAVTPDRTFIRITAPAKEAGTGTLRIGANMWNYLPQVERVIKIPPSLMLQSWMGSDFTNDDFVKESSLVHDYTHAVDGEEVEGGDLCYRLIATPKPDAPVVWGKLVLWIRKTDDVPRKEEYYGESGDLRKVLTFDDVRTAGDRPYPMRWTMRSVTKPGHETVLEFHSIVFDQPIPDRIFTQQNLKQAY